ncbi:hypothetical protein IFM89_002284 [Coptis chinensis]|uniref:Uncharacterized protein n=1 Tax=Coptis chinensis TaxID=261450 RepID=A0A835IK36_9MAGN|nr:hypothetical protein IFM89_002284 [Coptis chinensis]
MVQIKYLQKNVDEALSSYEELAKEDPNDYRPYFYQFVIYSLLDRNEEVKAQFAKCREVCPKDFKKKPCKEGGMYSKPPKKLLTIKGAKWRSCSIDLGHGESMVENQSKGYYRCKDSKRFRPETSRTKSNRSKHVGNHLYLNIITHGQHKEMHLLAQHLTQPPKNNVASKSSSSPQTSSKPKSLKEEHKDNVSNGMSISVVDGSINDYTDVLDHLPTSGMLDFFQRIYSRSHYVQDVVVSEDEKVDMGFISHFFGLGPTSVATVKLNKHLIGSVSSSSSSLTWKSLLSFFASRGFPDDNDPIIVHGKLCNSETKSLVPLY